ncbi:MAG: glycoside hydrolase family 76 protein [Candidatus Cryptobacteroides sp.]
MKFLLKFLPLTVLLAFIACSKQAAPENPGDDGDDVSAPSYNWNKYASAAQASLEKNFWREETGNYWIDNIHDDKTFYHYWQTAHAMETIMDAYERTSDEFYRDRVRVILARIKQSTGGGYINNYYDDMSWMGIACLRAYDLFLEEEYLNAAGILWEDVQHGWVEPDGGMLWNKKAEDAGIRNSCTHWTVADFGARMYRHTKRKEDLEFASKVYRWAYENLYDSSLGGAFGSSTNKSFLTYNQGVLIGSSLNLYDITKRQTYRTAAEKCADFCIRNDKFGKEGIWRDEGAKDDLNKNNGVFKGILCHYLKEYICSEYCNPDKRKAYVQYMEQMGVTLYNAVGYDWLIPGDWTRCAKDSERIYLGCQLSGAILMECNYVFSKTFVSL